MRLLPRVLVASLVSCASFGQTYTVSTMAGGGLPVNISGLLASLGEIGGVAVDSAGNVFIASTSNYIVLRLDSAGVLTLVAGNGSEGFSGDNGPATSAQFFSPQGVAVDSAGNLYIADAGSSRIRKVSNGIITTVAGSGCCFSGDNGPATSARMRNPTSVAVDSGGNLYIADTGNFRIRKVSNGVITTVAGNGTPGFSGDNGLATSAQLGGQLQSNGNGINGPSGVAVDSAGNLYIADTGNARIRKVSNGVITTVAGNGTPGFSGDNGPATSAQLGGTSGTNGPFLTIAVDTAGGLYIEDTSNFRIRKISNGVITTVAGNGTGGFSGDNGPATSAQLSTGPGCIAGASLSSGVAVDLTGNLYIADSSNVRIRKVSNGVITTVAGNGKCSFGGDDGPATNAQLGYLSGTPAVDATGSLYIADTDNHRIRKVSNGVITTVAGNGTYGFSGDNGPATSAQFFSPQGVAVDSAGNLYIADYGNNRIRKISNGMITTVAGNGTYGFSGDNGPATDAELAHPGGVAVDSAGNLYIADYGNFRIRKVSNGVITTVAGNGTYGFSGDNGPATSAQLDWRTDFEGGVAVDSGGSLYIADTDNNRIRKVSNGVITTVAGNGTYGFSGDNGPATSAELFYPTGVAVDAGGDLYIADYSNERIRKVSSGVITTIAGGGSIFADGGLATNSVVIAFGITADSKGDVYFTEPRAPTNGRVRVLTPRGSSCTSSVSPTSLQLPASGGNLTVNIQTTAPCTWTISGLPSWITASGASSGTGSASVTLIVGANTGAPRFAQISIAGITVTVNQASNVLLISTGGVVNGASYTASVAPGSIAAIFGNFLLAAPVSVSSFPIPSSLGGLSFQFGGGFLTPLFYANFGQVNGQVPWELASQSQTTITATNSGQTSTPQMVNLASYAPGIFAINGGGTGQGAIQDTNYHVVDSTNPAIAGSTVVQIYCTGLGPVTHQPATGAASPSNALAETITQPTVMIGGAPAKVQFSGLTPGDVGLYQVNAQVSAASTKGSAVPVVISIGGVQSNTVTIAVQ